MVQYSNYIIVISGSFNVIFVRLISLFALSYPIVHSHFLIFQLMPYPSYLMIILLKLLHSPDFMSDPLCFHLFSSFSLPQVLRVGLVLVELDLDSLISFFGSWLDRWSKSSAYLIYGYFMLGLCLLFYVLRTYLSRWIISVFGFVVGFWCDVTKLFLRCNKSGFYFPSTNIFICLVYVSVLYIINAPPKLKHSLCEWP